MFFFKFCHSVNLSNFRNNSNTPPFNSSTEGTLLRCLLQTAHNACNSKDVDAPKFKWVRHNTFYNGQNQLDSTECLLMFIYVTIRAPCPIQVRQLLPRGLLYLISCFHLFWKNILSAMYVDWGTPHLSLVVCYIFYLLTLLQCETWF